MKRFMTIFFSIALLAVSGQEKENKAINEVLRNLLSDRVSEVKIEIKKSEKAQAELFASENEILVKASDPVSAIHAVYQYLKKHSYGFFSWSGKRVNLPRKWIADKISFSSPFKNRYYFNVVTYGYTMPYWDWKRWEKEIDWMALHGINMPLALVATEAISERVWKKLGLTQNEIDIFYTAPAHLPWQRMGNISNHDGKLSQGWHKNQIKLQQKILEKMRLLGMKPIVPAFAGFVPKDLKRIYPEIEINRLSWGGFPAEKSAYLLSPNSETFAKIGELFIAEWEKEFGKCDYYLADSFNEMDLPKSEKPVTELLADYGNAIYQSIKAGNPNATWVVQGWMFGYQRYIWKPENVKALFSKVPDDKLFILDEACDYNGTFWRNGMNYELYDGFFGKPYGIGYIPNMGGKSGWTGVWDFYANCAANALKYPKKGKLIGYGICPEGIENNEMLYEFLTDAAWSEEPMNVQNWLKINANARYGSFPLEIQEAWNLFLKSCYNTFTDHPRLGWQYFSFGGSINRSTEFLQGVEKFLSCAKKMQKEKLYINDGLELASTYAGIKADEWFTLAKKANDNGDAQLRDKGLKEATKLLSTADMLLREHSTLNLQNWVDFARNQGETPDEKDAYEENARRLVTVWGPPVNDYSARMWSGLISDFYLPRMQEYFRALAENRSFNRGEWEEKWIKSKKISKVKKINNIILKAHEWVIKAKNNRIPEIKPPEGDIIGEWFPNQLSTNWQEIDFRVTGEQIKKAKSVFFQFTEGSHRLEIAFVAVIADGKEIYRDTHNGSTGSANNANRYKIELPKKFHANNDCMIRVKVRTEGGNNSKGKVMLLNSK